jgi:hypothetical protein
VINLNLLSDCLSNSDIYLCRLVPVKKVHWEGDSIKYIIRLYSYTKEEKLGISSTLGIISINNSKEGMIRYSGSLNIRMLYRIISSGVRLEWGFKEGAGNGYELYCKNLDDNIGELYVGAFQKESSRVKGVRTREEILASKNARAALEKLFN